MTTLLQKSRTKLIELKSLKLLLFTVVASVTFVLTLIKTIVIFFFCIISSILN